MKTKIINPKLNDSDWIKKQYIEDKRPLQSIADELGVARNTLRNRLIEFGIERRASGEPLKGIPKPPELRAVWSKARKEYWDNHPDRTEFRTKISKTKEKHRTSYGYRRVSTLIDSKRRREHDLIMEQIIGRKLNPDEQVHHINGEKLDNRPENLMVLTNSEHQKLHNKSRPRNKKGQFLK